MKGIDTCPKDNCDGYTDILGWTDNDKEFLRDAYCMKCGVSFDIVYEYKGVKLR